MTAAADRCARCGAKKDGDEMREEVCHCVPGQTQPYGSPPASPRKELPMTAAADRCAKCGLPVDDLCHRVWVDGVMLDTGYRHAFVPPLADDRCAREGCGHEQAEHYLRVGICLNCIRCDAFLPPAASRTEERKRVLIEEIHADGVPPLILRTEVPAPPPPRAGEEIHTCKPDGHHVCPPGPMPKPNDPCETCGVLWGDHGLNLDHYFKVKPAPSPAASEREDRCAFRYPAGDLCGRGPLHRVHTYANRTHDFQPPPAPAPMSGEWWAIRRALAAMRSAVNLSNAVGPDAYVAAEAAILAAFAEQQREIERLRAKLIEVGDDALALVKLIGGRS